MTVKERGKKTEQAIERLLKRAQMARDMTPRREKMPPVEIKESEPRGWFWPVTLSLLAVVAGYFVFAD